MITFKEFTRPDYVVHDFTCIEEELKTYFETKTYKIKALNAKQLN